MEIERIEIGPRMSQAVVYRGIVYLAGQVATGARACSMTEQTKDILANVDSLLSQADSHKSRILSATIALTDIAAFSEMNAVWEAWIDPKAPPARTATGGATLASDDFALEITIVAAQ